MPGKRPITDEEAPFVVLAAATGGGQSKLVERFDLVGATVHINMSSGTITVEASNDGVFWVVVVTAATADAIEVLAGNFKFLRVNTTIQPTDAVVTLFAHELLW